MILQTSVKISIFLQDRYNPIAHSYFRVCFWVAVGASGVGKLPQQHSWWWPCGLSFFFRCGGERGKHQPPHIQAGHQALWFKNLKLCFFSLMMTLCKDLWTRSNRLWSSFRISILSGLTDREKLLCHLRRTLLVVSRAVACLWISPLCEKKKKKHTKGKKSLCSRM